MNRQWPTDVIERYRKHFDRVRTTVGDDLHSIATHFGASPGDEAWLLLDRIVSWNVYQDFPLSPAERMVAGAAAIRTDVQNGGFHQYFFNSAGDLWRDVLRTLQLGDDSIGESHFPETLKIFRDSSPAEDRDDRIRQLDELEDRDADGMWAHFNRQDRQYYEIVYPSPETLWGALCKLPNQRLVPTIDASRQ